MWNSFNASFSSHLFTNLPRLYAHMFPSIPFAFPCPVYSPSSSPLLSFPSSKNSVFPRPQSFSPSVNLPSSSSELRTIYTGSKRSRASVFLIQGTNPPNKEQKHNSGLLSDIYIRYNKKKHFGCQFEFFNICICGLFKTVSSCKGKSGSMRCADFY